MVSYLALDKIVGVVIMYGHKMSTIQVAVRLSIPPCHLLCTEVVATVLIELPVVIIWFTAASCRAWEIIDMYIEY